MRPEDLRRRIVPDSIRTGIKMIGRPDDVVPGIAKTGKGTKDRLCRENHNDTAHPCFWFNLKGVRIHREFHVPVEAEPQFEDGDNVIARETYTVNDPGGVESGDLLTLNGPGTVKRSVLNQDRCEGVAAHQAADNEPVAVIINGIVKIRATNPVDTNDLLVTSSEAGRATAPPGPGLGNVANIAARSLEDQPEPGHYFRAILKPSRLA